LPLLIASDHGVLVNTSSVNGFWASLGPGTPNTAYAAAKFAVRGFSEALIEDLRAHAPHVRVAVVMPGACWPTARQPLSCASCSCTDDPVRRDFRLGRAGPSPLPRERRGGDRGGYIP
jgi:NAD(P)-dependent dehydrogenase (short-subunit alcohol dehydrogenase family)